MRSPFYLYYFTTSNREHQLGYEAQLPQYLVPEVLGTSLRLVVGTVLLLVDLRAQDDLTLADEADLNVGGFHHRYSGHLGHHRHRRFR